MALVLVLDADDSARWQADQPGARDELRRAAEDIARQQGERVDVETADGEHVYATRDAMLH
jgi:hypothetical protein